MKQILLISFLLYSGIVKSQISVTNEIEKTPKAVPVPEPFNPSTNLNDEKLSNEKDYYFGQTGFFAPLEFLDQGSQITIYPSFNSVNEFAFNVANSKIANRSFLILEAITSDELVALIKKKSDSLKISYTYDELPRKYQAVPYLKIQDLENQNIYYFQPDTYQLYNDIKQKFILSNYYKYLKSRYLNKKIIATNSERMLTDSYHKVKNLLTDEFFNIPFKSLWIIEDITFLKN